MKAHVDLSNKEIIIDDKYRILFSPGSFSQMELEEYEWTFVGDKRAPIGFYRKEDHVSLQELLAGCDSSEDLVLPINKQMKVCLSPVVENGMLVYDYRYLVSYSPIDFSGRSTFDILSFVLGEEGLKIEEECGFIICDVFGVPQAFDVGRKIDPLTRHEYFKTDHSAIHRYFVNIVSGQNQLMDYFGLSIPVYPKRSENTFSMVDLIRRICNTDVPSKITFIFNGNDYGSAFKGTIDTTFRRKSNFDFIPNITFLGGESMSFDNFCKYMNFKRFSKGAFALDPDEPNRTGICQSMAKQKIVEKLNGNYPTLQAWLAEQEADVIEFIIMFG